MYKVAPISTRNQFGQLLNERGLLGEAVEIGTHRGDFAKQFRSEWRGRLLTCVDPWREGLPGYGEQEALLVEAWGRHTREQDMAHFRKEMSTFSSSRWTFMRMTSSEAAEAGFQNDQLDFVYVDGDHRFAEVLRDLTTWWPKVKSGGILAGHDWAQPGEKHRWADNIQKALAQFLAMKGLDSEPDAVDAFLVVEENGLPWSFFMEKP